MKRIKVKYKKLGKQKALGQAHCGYNTIEIDERLYGKKLIEIIVHESLHILFPDIEEEEVVSKSIVLTNTLWHEGIRMIDNENSIPLQDGSI